jgi:tetratricopeptide (TPR) repeat protein
MGSGSSVSVNDSSEKTKGDSALRAGHYPEAILWYSLPLSLYEINQENKHIMIILLCNRSMAYCMNGQYHLALSDAEKVIELDPLWPKGYFQAAKVRISVSLFFSTDSRHLKVAIELMMLIITISELKHSLFMTRPSMKLSVEFNLI